MQQDLLDSREVLGEEARYYQVIHRESTESAGPGSAPRSRAPAPRAQRLRPALWAWASWPRVPCCLTRARANQGERPGLPCDGLGGPFPQRGQREERSGARREPSRAAAAEEAPAPAHARASRARIPGRPARRRARLAAGAQDRSGQSKMAGILAWFWNERFWLPHNVTWADLKNTEEATFPQAEDLYVAFPLAFCIFMVRLIFERFVAKPCAIALNIQANGPQIAQPNAILEKVFTAITKHPDEKRLEGLSKQLDWDVRSIQRWFRQRRNQEKPSTLTRFCESM
ncbi:PREDICTED: uncharacterized protein LOC106801532 [Ceratotherium simum simum]|uniref:Uncharacterized protein LOC106801532 n=1 Tax=Ceratotherium simum simum TaxID=73337 RepID=A0ABM1CPM2_CERSS|nr:PREDICTED: uncharacterized protein LOC106801532 [Ceratotherium simum simum]